MSPPTPIDTEEILFECLILLICLPFVPGIYIYQALNIVIDMELLSVKCFLTFLCLLKTFIYKSAVAIKQIVNSRHTERICYSIFVILFLAWHLGDSVVEFVKQVGEIGRGKKERFLYWVEFFRMEAAFVGLESERESEGCDDYAVAGWERTGCICGEKDM